MSHTTASTLAVLLLVVACSEGSDASTTSTTGSTTSTTSAGSTTSVAGTTTTEATGTTGTGPPGTLPPVIAAAVFDFTGGAGSISVLVEVGESPDGPWLPAGFSADTVPLLTSSNYWVRFTIQNLDQLNGTVVDLEISGFDNSDLGTDVCSIDEIPVGGTATCVAGGDEGYTVEIGQQQNDYTISAVAERQGFPPDRWLQPPVPTDLDYGGSRHSFVLLFETDIAQGTRVEGTSDGPAIEVDVQGLQLSSAVAVDCSDDFPDGVSATGGSPAPGEPLLVAYVIENFSEGGESAGGCQEIPTGTVEMDVEGDNSGYLYEGLDVGSD
jgi:hypothetical protein